MKALIQGEKGLLSVSFKRKRELFMFMIPERVSLPPTRPLTTPLLIGYYIHSDTHTQTSCDPQDIYNRGDLFLVFSYLSSSPFCSRWTKA